MKKFLWIIGLLVFTVPAFAQIPSTKHELVMKLLNVNGTQEIMRKNVAGFIAQTPQAQQPQLTKLLNVDEIIAVIAPLYENEFSEKELSGLIDFYQSDLGKKILQTTPRIAQASMEAVGKYFQEKLGGAKKPDAGQ
ncbi:MAG: DUF2059 domain-containing protein [Candidatus Omnitrophica bacterium]|nr:DUF2059 domain-containing protein [Candidatus Omnitrophota bacterium]